jgi:hypothetical protein
MGSHSIVERAREVLRNRDMLVYGEADKGVEKG